MTDLNRKFIHIERLFIITGTHMEFLFDLAIPRAGPLPRGSRKRMREPMKMDWNVTMIAT